MPNIFTFVDYTGFLTEVFEEDLNFAGAWSASINYYRFDVVTHGETRYICTSANTNTEPPIGFQFSAFWSIIAFTSTGTGSSGTNSGGTTNGASLAMVEDVYSLAYRAYQIALTGTDLPAGSSPPWVMEWIGHTYNIARAGTNAANSADMWARDAYHIAVNGTNAANEAWGYAGQAWNIAVTGTNSADQAYGLALYALHTAWDGTDSGGPGSSGTVPEWVMEWIGHTYNLAITGTSAAATAQAMATAAQLDAYSAWQYAGQAWTIAVTGTNAANQADSIAQQALAAAWAGTNAGASGFVRLTGDTMTGTLQAPAVYLGHGTTTVPGTGTVVVDFTGLAYQTVFMASDTAFDGTNYGNTDATKTITYRLFSGNSSRTLRFNPSFVALRESPRTIAAGKLAIASFSCFGTSPADVVFGYAEQSLW